MCQQQNSSGFADKGFCTCAEQTSWSLCETAEMAIDAAPSPPSRHRRKQIVD